MAIRIKIASVFPNRGKTTRSEEYASLRGGCFYTHILKTISAKKQTCRTKCKSYGRSRKGSPYNVLIIWKMLEDCTKKRLLEGIDHEIVCALGPNQRDNPINKHRSRVHCQIGTQVYIEVFSITSLLCVKIDRWNVLPVEIFGVFLYFRLPFWRYPRRLNLQDC